MGVDLAQDSHSRHSTAQNTKKGHATTRTADIHTTKDTSTRVRHVEEAWTGSRGMQLSLSLSHTRQTHTRQRCRRRTTLRAATLPH